MINDINDTHYLSEDYSSYSSDCSECSDDCEECNMFDKICFLFPNLFLEEHTCLEMVLDTLKNINNINDNKGIININNRKDLNDFFDYLMNKINHEENNEKLSTYWEIFMHYEKLIYSNYYNNEWKIVKKEESSVIYSTVNNTSSKNYVEFTQRCNIFFNKYFPSYTIDIIRTYKNEKLYIFIYLSKHKNELK